MMSLINELLIDKNRDTILYFDEFHHKYTDNYNGSYLSVTQFLNTFKKPFPKRKQAISSSRRRDGKYYGWPIQKILDDWERLSKLGCERGNIKHSYFETNIKKASRYTKYGDTLYINSRIHTIREVILNNNYGKLDLDYFRKLGFEDRYPTIFKKIEILTKDDWEVYAEVGVYNPTCLISGLIDCIFIKGNRFIILDWKTNADPMTRIPGYYKKDSNGRRTSLYIEQREKHLLYPLDHIPDSNLYFYELQVSMYARLVEFFGLEHVGSMICHVREDESGKEEVKFVPTRYVKEDIDKILYVKMAKLGKTGKVQLSLFN